jgi:TIR domain
MQGREVNQMAEPKIGAPKVFVSHASDDKARFVLRFAEKLRSKGIDAWVDKWEILPGDSLVDKIFEEGLKDAVAVIIVLSKNSVNKPWVREELNASVVQKIEKQTKIIPVVIDDCEIPAALQSTVWERVRDLANFDQELDRIVAAIFDHRSKPPLGGPPGYTREVVIPIAGLTQVDNLVLRLTCEEVLRVDSFIAPDQLYVRTDAVGLGREDVLDSLEVLGQRGYLKLSLVLGGVPRGISHFKPTLVGMETFASSYIPEYSSSVRLVAAEILNHDNRDNRAIASAIRIHGPIVDHILNQLEARGLLKLSKSISGAVFVVSISPELKRAFS